MIFNIGVNPAPIDRTGAFTLCFQAFEKGVETCWKTPEAPRWCWSCRHLEDLYPFLTFRGTWPGYSRPERTCVFTHAFRIIDTFIMIVGVLLVCHHGGTKSLHLEASCLKHHQWPRSNRRRRKRWLQQVKLYSLCCSLSILSSKLDSIRRTRSSNTSPPPLEYISLCLRNGSPKRPPDLTMKMSLLGPVLRRVGKPPRHDKASSFVEGKSRAQMATDEEREMTYLWRRPN